MVATCIFKHKYIALILGSNNIIFIRDFISSWASLYTDGIVPQITASFVFGLSLWHWEVQVRMSSGILLRFGASERFSWMSALGTIGQDWGVSNSSTGSEAIDGETNCSQEHDN